MVWIEKRNGGTETKSRLVYDKRQEEIKWENIIGQYLLFLSY